MHLPCAHRPETCSKKTFLGEHYAIRKIQEAASDSGPTLYDTSIKTSEERITLIEPILFRTYGRKNIVSQRPYEIYLIHGYWFISGTLLQNRLGGTFEAIIKAQNGKIITVDHYK